MFRRASDVYILRRDGATGCIDVVWIGGLGGLGTAPRLHNVAPFLSESVWKFLRKCIDTTGHAGRRGAPSGQAGTYPLVGG
eukprot:6346101-Prymnesium_polylepis.3